VRGAHERAVVSGFLMNEELGPNARLMHVFEIVGPPRQGPQPQA
jgi:hypothetical protein